MCAPILSPANQSPTLSSQSGVETSVQTPTGKSWPRFNEKVEERELIEVAKESFGYEPHKWQLEAAMKVLEGNDGIVVAGTGKGKTMVFALLGLAVKLSGTMGYYIIVSPLKALEGDQVCFAFDVRGLECLLKYRAQVARMKKAGIKAVAFNENTSQEHVSKALRPEKGVSLIFASPEYLLRNPRMKKLYANEGTRTHILGVLVDEAHVIHEWAKKFRKDYAELKTLRVILGNNVPWWALSATLTDEIFESVYETLSFGTSRAFWGINVGTDRPNLAQHVLPMGSAASSYLPLVPFIPEGAQTKDDIPKTIIFFRSISETRDACLAIRALLPSHLQSAIQPFAAPDEESTKEQRMKDLTDGCICVLCCTIAAGMGCDIPDIEVAVIYGVDSFVSFVQKGGRAGRNGKVGARMVWLVEDWLFEEEGKILGKRTEDKLANVDPVAREYIRHQMSGRCLRNFTKRVFQPNPETLGLPGFGERAATGLEVVWTTTEAEAHPEPGKCCSASSCRAPGSNLDAGYLTEAEKDAAESRHNLILKVLRVETSTAQGILGPPPGKGAIRCPKEERAIFQAALEKWRDEHWESVSREASPMLDRAWVLGDSNIKQLVDQIRRILCTDKEKINRRWIRALIDTAADDTTVDSLSKMIRRFHDECFFRLKEREPYSNKFRKISTSNSQQCPPSPTESMFTQDSYLDPGDPPCRPHTCSQMKRKRAAKPAKAAPVSTTFPRRYIVTDRRLEQRPQQPSQLPPPV